MRAWEIRMFFPSQGSGSFMAKNMLPAAEKLCVSKPHAKCQTSCCIIQLSNRSEIFELKFVALYTLIHFQYHSSACHILKINILRLGSSALRTKYWKSLCYLKNYGTLRFAIFANIESNNKHSCFQNIPFSSESYREFTWNTFGLIFFSSDL